MDPYNQDSQIQLALHPLTEAKIIVGGMRAKIGEYCGLVHGRPRLPDDPEGRNRFSPDCCESLRRPTAIFKGVKRPLHHVHSDADADVLIYAASFPRTFKFKHHRDYGGVLETSVAPKNSVFTSFVSLHEAHVDAATVDMRKVPSGNVQVPAGVVLWWEWTEAGPDALPLDHATRYGTRLL